MTANKPANRPHPTVVKAILLPTAIAFACMLGAFAILMAPQEMALSDEFSELAQAISKAISLLPWLLFAVAIASVVAGAARLYRADLDADSRER